MMGNDTRNRLKPPDNPDCVVAKTTTHSNGSYPSDPANPRVKFAMIAVDIGGDEVEGATATFEPKGAIFLALNLGSKIPPEGSKVICHRMNGRWTFSF